MVNTLIFHLFLSFSLIAPVSILANVFLLLSFSPLASMSLINAHSFLELFGIPCSCHSCIHSFARSREMSSIVSFSMLDICIHVTRYHCQMFPNGGVCTVRDSIALHQTHTHQFSIHFVYHFYCLRIEHHRGRLATAFLPSRVWQFSSLDIDAIG